MSSDKKSNKLIHEKSPYLLQHAHNPVNWNPWSEEALNKAKSEDKPIFLSIGYSTCHWCHVMERESFEDEEVANILNKHFISIKVDREERTDIDHIYMNICQALTGHGGWPLTIIMTPDKKPFFAGTYFPKHSNYGRSGLIDILTNTADTWKENKNKLIDSSNYITKTVQNAFTTNFKENINKNILDIAFKDFKNSFDNHYGGFGFHPKFPTSHNLYFLLRYWYNTNDNSALLMVEKTLENMYRGGIYDHVGFGFSRYSTDQKWLVPHFEKMLYDNALISIAYLETYQITKNELFAKISKDTFTYILRDMTSPDGGFYSAEDADSEGVEGKFYVWNYDEIINLLGESDGINFCKQLNITKNGNFEGKNIPNLIASQSMNIDENIRQKLFNYRNKRIHPYKDDKILTSWNGLMIAALSIGGRILQDNNYTNAAQKAVEFIYNNLIDENGRLLARYRDGESSFPAYANDYAFLIWGLIELYETTFNSEYIQKAIALNDDLIKYFWDEKDGGLYIYGSDSEQLITRPKEVYDGATPSANSVATLNWLRLSRLTGNNSLEELASKQFNYFGSKINEHPSAYTFMLLAYSYMISDSKEIVIVGDLNSHDTQEMIRTTYKNFNPYTTVLLKSEKSDNNLDNLAPFITDYQQINNKTTAYVCENYSCQAPLTDINELNEVINEN